MKEAIEQYEPGFVEEYDPIVLSDGTIDVEEIYWDDEEIHISFSVKRDKIEIAYTSIDVDIPFDVLVDAVIHKIKNNDEILKRLESAMVDVK